MTIEEMNRTSHGNMVGHLGIEYTAAGEDFLEGRMPVDERTTQPLGLLHGGASAAFAETLGSMASMNLVDAQQPVVGIELNLSHLRKATEGYVTGRAQLISRSRQLHVWQIDIRNEVGQPTCSARLTVMVLQKK